jgi:predicted Zn-dependent protease
MPQNEAIPTVALPIPAPVQTSPPVVETASPIAETLPVPAIRAEAPFFRTPQKTPAPLSSAAPKEPVASRLREESRALGEAREALRSGDAEGAIERLDALGNRYPDGILAQEREALAIEALYRVGKRDAAQTRAAAFLRAYPSSPHATKIRALLP